MDLTFLDTFPPDDLVAIMHEVFLVLNNESYRNSLSGASGVAADFEFQTEPMHREVIARIFRDISLSESTNVQSIPSEQLQRYVADFEKFAERSLGLCPPTTLGIAHPDAGALNVMPAYIPPCVSQKNPEVLVRGHSDDFKASISPSVPAPYTEVPGTGRMLDSESAVRDLLVHGDEIRMIRSGVYFDDEPFEHLLEEACKISERPKIIRIVLPSIKNADLFVRAKRNERNFEEVLAHLAARYESLSLLSRRLKPKHTLELRTTMEPHRYYAIFSELRRYLASHGILRKLSPRLALFPKAAPRQVRSLCSVRISRLCSAKACLIMRSATTIAARRRPQRMRASKSTFRPSKQ